MSSPDAQESVVAARAVTDGAAGVTGVDPDATTEAAAARAARKFFAPEVIQTSAMDCGPAVLKCLLEGFGVDVSYGRLREACQTSVDGTSIDTLETIAVSLGLDAEQVMMPVDHLLLPEAEALPAIVVMRQPTGLTHFVVAWRVHGGFVQVMDPARGRRWVRRAELLRDVYVHSLAVPAEAFEAWARSDGFTAPLARRLRDLGVPDGDAGAAVARTLGGTAGWAPIAALDAAVRTVAGLVATGAVARGAEARRLVEALAAAPARPAVHATGSDAPPAADGSAQVTMRGALIIQVAGARPLGAAERDALPVELRSAVDEAPVRPAAELVRLLRLDGRGLWGALAGGVALAAIGTVVEAVLFRGLVNAAGRAAYAALALTLVALAALEWPLALGLRRAGARLEERLRRLFLRKIPRLPDRYFQSRPMSDMAERAHLLHRLRALPTLAGDVARAAIEIVVVATALVWVDPGGAPLAIALAVAMLLIPFATERTVAERDLRMRNHAGALARFTLDGLIGLLAVRTHGAEAALAREHRDRLAEWVRAARGALGAALAAEATSALVGFGLGAWLLASYFTRAAAGGGAAGGGAGTALLVVYWALSLPTLGYELALLVQQLPAQRNLTLRLVEPLGAPEEEAKEEAPASAPPAHAPEAPADRGVRVEMSGVRVAVAGHEILDVGALAFAAGEQVAIVGASGAGKSSLLGLLLGWHRAAVGTVTVDGRPLDAGVLEALRRRTVWVDPSVYVWNRSLAANLAFGLATTPAGLVEALRDADLDEVVARLPGGADTPLGEAGGLLSGGEGQRVRFGRALLRPAPGLVLLDEPFRGLDRDRRRDLLARARRRWPGATLLCVTHDIAETEAFPRVVVIAGGRVVEDGAPAALRAQAGSRYAALLEAERRVRAAAWSGARWRRLRVADGRVVDGGRADGDSEDAR
jgi:ATP-binding cassette subfamily B protein